MGCRRGDVAVAAGVLALNVVAVLTTADGSGRPLMPWGWVLLVVSCAALLWRERFPVAVLAVTAAAATAYYPLGFPDGPIVLALVIALYTVARRHGPLPAAGVAGVLAAAAIGTAHQPLQAAIGIVPLLLLPVVLGEVARGRARQTAQAEEGAAVAEERAALAEERAALAEATQESEALRRAAEERLRIARELHDVLAHQISLINVQAGAALHTRQPEAAVEPLRAIRLASGDALKEIRSVLCMLRESPRPDQDAAPGSSAPGLTALPELFRRTEDAGLTVRATVDLPPPALPAGVQTAAYRIVQEALTNVVRHSPATAADVTIHRTGAGVEITVENDGPAVERTEAGNGMRGMAERAAAAGGDLHAGPRPPGGFRVQARLPIPSGESVRARPPVTPEENGTR